MSPLQLVLLFALHIRVSVCLKETRLYSRSGSAVVLSCDRESDSDCSRILWLYSRNGAISVTEVKDGRVQSESSRAARLKLIAGCSLIISSITAEDIGQYTCRHGRDVNNDIVTFLGVLTLSPADPEVNSEVTLKCSVHRDSQLSACKDNSIQWFNKTGNVLRPGEEVDSEFITQTGCYSDLTVRRQSGRRTFTCRFVGEGNNVEADYTLDFPDVTEAPPPTPAPGSDLSLYIIVGVAAGVVVMLIIIIAVFIKHRKRAKMAAAQENRAKYHQKPAEHPSTEKSFDGRTSERPAEEELDSTVTYATVVHAKHRASPNIMVPEEEVTYSTLKSSVGADI
ncbi:uncharacterized protein V6R79_019293 [Siganus canaliculatus]